MQVANRGAEPAGSVGSPGSSAQQEKNQQQQQIEMKQESSGSTPAPFPVPSGVEADEYETVRESIARHHTYEGAEWDKCCHSMMFQRINARADVVWSVVSRFDKPQTYKHFVRSCSMKGDGKVGSVREVCVVSGLPAETSTERLDVLDEERHVISFSVVGGEHRLRNYRSVTTLHEFVKGDGSTCTVVLESYVVDVPEGNTRDDTCLFADTVVRCNLQALAQLAEHLQQGRDRRGA